MISKVAGLALKASSVLCLFVAVYLIVVHGWELKYVVPIVLAVALAVAAGLNPERRINAALAWVATVISRGYCSNRRRSSKHS